MSADEVAGEVANDNIYNGWKRAENSFRIESKVQISKIEGKALRNLGIYNFRNSEFYKVLPKGEYTFAINSQQLKGTKSIQVAVEKQDNKSITPNYVILSE